MSWQSINPDWEYKLWGYEEMENLVHTQFPAFYETYKSFPEGVQRWDAIRYMILFSQGGVYADLDSECLEPIEPLLEGKSCCFGLEPPKHSKIFNTNKLIGNAFMAAEPQNSFFEHILEDIKSYRQFDKDTIHYVMKTTGPLMLNRVYSTYKNRDSIDLISHKLVTPITRDEVFDILNSKAGAFIEEKIEKAYAVHYFFNTWYNNGNGMNLPI